jgi:nitrite reductase (NO-forming)
VALGLCVVVVAAGAGFAIDRGSLNLFREAAPVSAGVAPTGHTTTVDVTAKDMRFEPATIDVPVGDRLVIRLKNTDTEDVHDLVLDDGEDTGRLAPGVTARLDVGVVGRDVAGWCSVIGHRQMGMALSIRDVGSPAVDTPACASSRHRLVR